MNIINEFIDKFKNKCSPKEFFTLKFEEMTSSPNVLNNLWKELGIYSQILVSKTEDLLKEKFNKKLQIRY